MDGDTGEHESRVLTAHPRLLGPRGRSPTLSQVHVSHPSWDKLSTVIMACCKTSKSLTLWGSSSLFAGSISTIVGPAYVSGPFIRNHGGVDQGRSSSPRRYLEGKGGSGRSLRPLGMLPVCRIAAIGLIGCVRSVKVGGAELPLSGGPLVLIPIPRCLAG